MLEKILKYISIFAIIATIVMAIGKLVGAVSFGWLTVFMPVIVLVSAMGVVLFFVVGIMIFMFLLFIFYVIYELAKQQ